MYFPSFEVDASSKVDGFERGLTPSSGDPACWPRPCDVVYLPLRQQTAIHLLLLVIFSFFPRYFIQMLSIIHISRIFGNWCIWVTWLCVDIADLVFLKWFPVQKIVYCNSSFCFHFCDFPLFCSKSRVFGEICYFLLKNFFVNFFLFINCYRKEFIYEK